MKPQIPTLVPILSVRPTDRVLVLGGHAWIAEVVATRQADYANVEVTVKNPDLLTTTTFEVEPAAFIMVVKGTSAL